MKTSNMIVTNFDFKTALIEANKRANQMVRNGLYSRFGLSEGKRLEKACLGCMGEIAFESLLRYRGITYDVDRDGFENRNSDEFDFLIGGKKIDIKVAKKTTTNPPSDRWSYGYPQEQNPASKDIVVIGWVDFNKEEVGFYGWLAGERIAQFPVVTQNTYAGYKYLTPNHEFMWGELAKNIESILVF